MELAIGISVLLGFAFSLVVISVVVGIYAEYVATKIANWLTEDFKPNREKSND